MQMSSAEVFFELIADKLQQFNGYDIRQPEVYTVSVTKEDLRAISEEIADIVWERMNR